MEALRPNLLDYDAWGEGDWFKQGGAIVNVTSISGLRASTLRVVKRWALMVGGLFVVLLGILIAPLPGPGECEQPVHQPRQAPHLGERDGGVLAIER
mgnify:CR=1 FL=1